MADGGGPRELYEAIRPVTRAWLTSAVLMMLAVKFNVVKGSLILFRWRAVWHDFEFWRVVTTFMFVGMPSFNTLIRLYNLYRYGQGLELNPFPSGTGAHEGNLADYAFQLGFVAAITLLLGALIDNPLLGPSLLAAVIYLWSKRNPNADVSLFFFRMKAIYLPWAMVALALVLGDDPVPDLLGICAAHVFYFLHEVLPGEAGVPEFLRGRNLAATPNWVYRTFGLPRTDFAAGQQRVVEQRAAFRGMGGLNAGGVGGGGGAPPGAPRFGGAGHILGTGR